MKLGVVGLNSAYLHFADDVEEESGLLDLTLEQFHSACGGNGPEWVAKHDVAILLTHHPLTWLREGGQVFLTEVCNGPDRFQFHLFGHMHTHGQLQIAKGWDDSRISIQCPSLFSLEKFGRQREQRTVGYNIGVLRRRGTQYEYSVWPRQQQLLDSGRQTLAPAPKVRYRADAPESTPWRVVPTEPTRAKSGSPLTDILDNFTEIGAFAGPRDYDEAHEVLKNWMRQHADRDGPIRVQNIAFDMQYTWPFVEGLLGREWRKEISWQTLLIDHRSKSLANALKRDASVRLKTAAESETKILEYIKQRKAKKSRANVNFAARAYTEVPPMHGFLINSELLIVAFCMLDEGRIASAPYLIFVKDGGSMNYSSRVVQRAISMFQAWFSRNWASGRKIGFADPRPRSGKSIDDSKARAKPRASHRRPEAG